MSNFENWLDLFISEKGIDITEEFKSTKDGISQVFSYKGVLECIKSTTKEEQAQIKNMLVKIDFCNGDIKDYLRHLSQALIPTREQIAELESTYGESIYGIEKENEESEEDEI